MCQYCIYNIFKISEKQLEECQQVEAYIKENRYIVLKNKKTNIKQHVYYHLVTFSGQEAYLKY